MIGPRVPWRLIGYAVLALLVLAALNSAASHIPFTPQWSARRAAAEAGRLREDVGRLERQAEGNAAVGRAVETYHSRELVIRDLTGRATTEALGAPDADTPLTDERANRLRAADRSLCDAAPGICPAADAPSGG